MAEKGLGMGLGALFGDAAIEPEKNDFEYLPVAKIEPRFEQPRNVFDEEALNELAESIGEHGVLQPLTVRKIDGGYYQIIAGERRWRAARIAGLDEVPARIIEADDRTALELALVENLQREGLNPVEEAAGYRQLMSDYGLTQEEVAAKVGKSRPVVANALRILSLPDEVLKQVESGDISSGMARVILSVEGDKKRIEAAKIITERKLSVREAEKLVKKLAQERPQKKKSRDVMLSKYIEEVEKRLTESLGRKVSVVYGKNKGKFEIEYYGADDFELLLSTLESLKSKKENSAE